MEIDTNTPTQPLIVNEGNHPCDGEVNMTTVMLTDENGQKQPWHHLTCPKCPLEWYCPKT